VYEPEGRQEATTAQLAADFLATLALFAGLAATIGGRDRWLVPVTVAVTGTCWFIGMTLAVLLERPIF
jgi:hypothetical protein